MSISKLNWETIQSLSNEFNFTFFTLPKTLSAVFPKTEWWGYSKGDELICIWPIPLSKNNKCFRNLPFTYYVGPIWKKLFLGYPEHRTLSTAIEVYNSFLKRFIEEYHFLDFEMPINTLDVRPFLWWKSANSNFFVEIKYTALLQIGPLEVMSKKFRQVRRWELRNIDFSHFNVVYNEFNNHEIIEFYKSKNFVSEADSYDYPLLETLERYLLLGPELNCYSITMREISKDNLVGFALLGLYGDCLNIILSFTHNDFTQEKYLSTALHKYIFEFAFNMGVKVLDFNGANGPQLSDFKHSWGASPWVYFKLRLQR